MLILIDHADTAEITRLLRYFPVDGVTTNPSILAREGGNLLATLRSIGAALPDGAQLHAQVLSTETDDMVAEALALRAELGQDLYVKIPVTADGYGAMRALSDRGVNVTATGIYTPMQAVLAAKSGVRYTAPYVSRIDNLGADGVRVATDIHTMLRAQGLKADVLAASFKNSQQIYDLCLAGIGSVTAAPDVLDGLLAHPSTNTAVAKQNADLHTLIGSGRTMADLCADAPRRASNAP